MRRFLHAKIHKATVTQADVSYVGSITIDRRLCELIGSLEGEKVLVTATRAAGGSKLTLSTARRIRASFV